MGGLCPRGGTTQGRRGQALKKKSAGTLLRQLTAEPNLSRARLEMLQKEVQTCTERRGRAVLAKGQRQRPERTMDICP